jgi:hypothetical protein
VTQKFWFIIKENGTLSSITQELIITNIRELVMQFILLFVTKTSVTSIFFSMEKQPDSGLGLDQTHLDTHKYTL